MTKEAMLRMLRDIAEAEGGDVSFRRFQAVSGLKEKQIIGVHWPTWNAAKKEAGLSVRGFVQPRLEDDVVIPAVAALIARLDKWPPESELRLAKRRDPRIPSVKTFARLSSDRAFLIRLRAYCEATPALSSVASLALAKTRNNVLGDGVVVATVGYVYMMRSGQRYKIGYTSSPSRRHREVRLDLPDRTDVVHTIETDDPKGIEAYWHGRFADKRIRDTEFFKLTAADVAAFRKRKFQ